MAKHAQDQARIVSVRLPDDLLQRLDRLLDWQTTHRRHPTTRNAAMRAWLDDCEQRAGLVEPHTLRQQFQAAYQRLHPHHGGVPIHQLRSLLPGAVRYCPGGAARRAAGRPRGRHGARAGPPSPRRQLSSPWLTLCPRAMAHLSGHGPLRRGLRT
jgi:hypothetical protein